MIQYTSQFRKDQVPFALQSWLEDLQGCVTLIVVIDAFEFENPKRTLDHLKESVSDIYHQSLRKFPSFTVLGPLVLIYVSINLSRGPSS